MSLHLESHYIQRIQPSGKSNKGANNKDVNTKDVYTKVPNNKHIFLTSDLLD